MEDRIYLDADEIYIEILEEYFYNPMILKTPSRIYYLWTNIS